MPVDPWEIVGYEAGQLRGALETLSTQQHLLVTQVLRNAVVESSVIHTRILCDILLSRTSAKDDIRLTDLFVPGITGPIADKIDKNMIAQLAKDYGSGSASGTPCWQFNKMLAHPTTERGLSYDYAKALRTLGPTIEKILDEIETLRKVRFPPIA